ncbi:MAG: hypothetical protein KC503_06150 [Myxococcales bacterium]|nr:hypothetical protein [Myxococcales bacterium]
MGARQTTTSVKLPATVQRFDIHQRIQHGSLAISVILLVLSGWPLSTQGVGASKVLVDLFGGLESCGSIHRGAALLLIFGSVYHLFYLIGLGTRRKLRLTMLPTPADVRDLVQNISYMLGMSKDRPRFPRYTYFEKFDYWAVFWGVVIMVGSGLVRWFPVKATAVLPTWAYEIAHYAHADEALLATLAIFIWHFYNVHLRPAVFPMSKVFLHGRLTIDELAHEHRAEYDELVAKLEREQRAETTRDEEQDEEKNDEKDEEKSDEQDDEQNEEPSDKSEKRE